MADAGCSFSNEADGLVACAPPERCDDRAVYAEFRKHCNISSSGDTLADDAKLLFKFTIDNKEKSKQSKPVFFVGVPQSTPFSAVVSLCNRTFCATKADQTAEHSSGAFLLQGGYAINPSKAACSIFMAYGNEVRACTDGALFAAPDRHDAVRRRHRMLMARVPRARVLWCARAACLPHKGRLLAARICCVARRGVNLRLAPRRPSPGGTCQSRSVCLHVSRVRACRGRASYVGHTSRHRSGDGLVTRVCQV